MTRFRESASGRLMTLAVALPLATGAFATVNPGGPDGMLWCMASVFAGIMIVFVAIALALENYERQVLGAIMALPAGLLAYIPLLDIASEVRMVRAGMALGAIVLVGLALAGTLPRLRFASSPRPTTHSA